MKPKLLTLDLESYYDSSFTLAKLTVAEYVHDPRFHLHGIAIRHIDGRCVFERDVGAAVEQLQADYGQHLERVTVLVHNGHFDLYALAKLFGLVPRYTVDSLQLAHALLGRKGEGGQSGKLADLAALMELPAKGDITWLSGVRLLDGLQAIKLAEYAKNDVGLTYQIAVRLLPQFSRPEVELPIAAHTLRLHHERGLRVDVAGIAGQIEAIQADARQWFDAAGITAKEAGSRKDYNELLAKALARTGRLLPMKQGKRGEIPATGKKDEAMQALLEDEDETVAALARARLARGSESQQVARLETLRHIATATGGVLPVHLVYHGAGTGRFAGGGKFNLQNLPKEGLGSRVRNLILPLPGQVFVAVDSSQIECRGTAWLAGEKSLLQAFTEGIDVYSREATAVFGREVRKPNKKTDTPERMTELDSMRQTGKQEILGLGFAMGARRFVNVLRADPKTVPLFGTGLLSPLVCRQIVDRFRSEFPRIPALWEEADAAFRSVALHGGTAWIGTMQVRQVDDRVELRLPSGRTLRYPRLRLETTTSEVQYLDREGEETSFVRTGETLVYGDNIKLFGGKIIENIAQALARDILVEAVLRLEKRGIQVVLHIHDEIIVMCLEADAEAVLAAIVEEMTRPVPWAPGLPLGAEGGIKLSLAK
jgi:hypothetical protein